jgi:hypothetical protein
MEKRFLELSRRLEESERRYEELARFVKLQPVGSSSTPHVPTSHFTSTSQPPNFIKHPEYESQQDLIEEVDTLSFEVRNLKHHQCAVELELVRLFTTLGHPHPPPYSSTKF